MLPSQSPRTTRVAAFRNGPRRRNRGPKAALALVLVVGVAGSLWWFWPEPSDAIGNELASESAPVTLSLQEAPSRTAQRAVQDLGRSTTAQPAETIAASPEPRTMEPAASTPPPPVELRQTLNPRTASADPRLASSTSSPSTSPPPAPTPRQTDTPAKTPVSFPAGSPASQPGQEAAPVNPGSGSSQDMTGRDSTVSRFISIADQAQNANKPVDARLALNRALHSPGASASERQMLRARIAELNNRMVFSAVVTPGDPLVETYTIQSGDRLAKIVDNHNLGIDWRLVQRINGISDPSKIRVGQKLKLLRGPFHAVVYKRDYRLDLYANTRDPDDNRLNIRSFSVGLGENNSTPTGKFAVKSGSKLIDPHWVNPRTGERFSNTDPKNPIGERWIGIEGIEPATQSLSGFGLHGTIEPQSIGHDASMGCVRMLSDDVEVVYEMLGEKVSTVEIRP